MNRTILTMTGVLSASSLLLVDSAVKGTVLLALAAVAALILRRDSAATRHLVWLLAIVAMLVVPVLSAMLPQWRVLPAWISSPRPAVAAVENASPRSIVTSAGEVNESPVRAAPVEVERPSAMDVEPATTPPNSQPALVTPVTPADVPAPMVWSWNWIDALPLVWAIGFAVLMLRLSAARWMLWNSERLATVICGRVAPQLAAESRCDSATTQDRIVVAMEAICSQLGIGRPVTLLIHPDKTIPVVWGILRCRLMLPAAARQWGDEQLQSVLLHELAHIKRRDTIVQLVTQVACALHWFNPLVRFAAWRLDVERERSCDDLVLASGIRPSAYAGHLLDVVTGLSPARWTQACGLAMARKSSLEGRLTAVLGKDLNRRGVSVALAGVALAIAVGVAVPIAMLRAADEKGSPQQVREVVAPTTNLTGKLAPETVAKLKWGEPVNGLRMALAYPPALGDALLGKEPYFQLVVQNVSEKAVRLTTGDAAPNPRRLTLQDATPVSRTVDDVPIPGDWLLQPREVAFVRLFHSEQKFENGKTLSAMEEHVVSTQPRYSYVADMTIAKAPAGAWTGKLVTGQTRGSADVAAAPAPKHKDARAIYEVWQRYARANGDIPGALVGELAAAVKTFIKYNPTWETVPKLNAILPRLDATHDWKSADAIALLDEVAGVQDSPLKAAAEKATRSSIRKGEALPKKFADAPWGDAQPNGLRAAWVLEPSAAEHRIGAALKARLLVWNSGAVSVSLQVPTFHQGGVKALDAKDAEVQVSGISWTTRALLVPVRLAPGEYIEIRTPGVGIGPRAGMGPWAGPRVGSNVLAKAGDELTLTHGLVPLDGSEVGVSQDAPHVSGPGWWLAHVRARLNRELPLPIDDSERTRMLDRAVRELFATGPTAEETAEFIADKTPDALEALAKRLTARVDVVSFSGKLPTAPAKFRVLAADANADKQPRVVLGPGEYPLSAGTGEYGAVTLKIVGKPVSDRRTNEAHLLFEPTEFTGRQAPDPHKLEVPDGWGSWAIVCRPDSGVLYLLSKGAVRKIDYTKPRNVTDTPANDLPAEFRDELKRILDIHEISAAQQAEIFEKPAPPAATPEAEKPKGAAVKLTLDALLGFWRGTMDGKDLMLSFHRPPVEKDVQLDIYFGRATIGRLARFKMAPDGDSALVVLEGGDNAVLGTLRPIDANTMRLEGAAKEGKAAAFAMLTRDVEPPATEPRQKEARELFEMWKRTANEDGTIPGTFIGQLATEVRAHVMANPNSDSGMKLPKLLPRFVTSRDWTQAEAIKLLDDLAYYSTRPIVARVAKAKLPSGPLWRTEVEFADLPVKISKWSEAKDGLRVGMRVVDADWRIGLGGGARVELWLHNAGDKDVTFKTTGPDRQDTGVAVAAIDVEGREHWADGVNVLIYAGPMDCKLPAGHVALAKKFKVTFAEPGSHEKTWLTPRFHGLKHGKYQLRCKWMDAYPDISKPGEWKGELTAPDHAFTLAAAVSAADLEVKPAPKLPLAAAVAAPQAAETPKRTEQEPFTAWGKEVGGLQAGLGFKAGEKRLYRHGETATLVVRVRNVGQNDIKFKYYPTFLSENSPTVLDETGKRVSLRGNTLRLVKHDVPKEVNLAVGKEIELHERELRLASGNEDAGELKTRDIFPTGKFLIQHEQVIGNSAQASNKLDPTLEKLATGKLEFEVREPFTAWGKEVGGLQAGFGFKVGEKRAYTHGEWATLVVRVRNVGKEEVKFQYLRQFFVEQPPTVFNEKGEVKQLGRTIALGVHSPVEVKLAAGKEIELYELKLYLGTGSEEGIPKYPYIFGTGKFQVQYKRVFGNSSSGSIKLDPALSKLATGKLELEIKPAAPVQQRGAQLNPGSGTGPVKIERLPNAASAPAQGAIRGKVLKPDASPAAGVEVRVDDGWKRWKFRGPGIPDLPWPVKTAADGTFSIEVAKGSVATNYEAFASSDDFAPLNAKVPVGGDVGVMQFAKGSRVTGRVIGLDGAGLAKVGIWCKRLDWHGRGPAPTKLTSTGADGTFSIPPIATGRHVLQILTRDLGAKELTVAFANHVIEAKDDAPVAVEIRPLPTVNLTLDARVLREKPEFPDFELRVSGTLPGHKAGEPGSYWTRQETTKLTKGKHTIAVPAGLQNVTLRADPIYMRKDDEPAFTWQREGDKERVSNNTLELGPVDQPQTISLTVQDAPTKVGVLPAAPDSAKKPTTDSTARKADTDDSAPPNQPQAAQGGKQSIKTIPVTSKELRGIWYGATDRTGVVVRFIGRESRIKGTQGVVSGEWVVNVVDGSVSSALDFTDDPKAGVVRITVGMWDDKAKQSFTLSLGTVERGEDDTLYLMINDNPREPMYLPAMRIPLIFIDDRVEIRRSDVEKMQSLMRTLKPR